jgi:AcrR family transcriptional regulator
MGYSGAMASAKPKISGHSTSQRESLSRADWEQSALELIAEKGIAGLRVEPLARRLGITKGSFYWHFSDRQDLLQGALKRWETLDSQHLQAFADFGHERDALENLEAFFRRTSRQQLTHRVYSALLSAPNELAVGETLKRVTDRRMAFLTESYQRLGYEAHQAHCHAQLTYCAYVGFLQLSPQGMAPEADTKAYEDYTEHLIQVLLRH